MAGDDEFEEETMGLERINISHRSAIVVKPISLLMNVSIRIPSRAPIHHYLCTSKGPDFSRVG